MEQVFGETYARSLGSDLVMAALAGRTAEQALADGVSPREVWDAVCDATGQDDATRWIHREDVRRAAGRRGPRRR